MKDYSRRYSAGTTSKQKVSWKKAGDRNGGRLWRAFGVLITVAMLTGIVASVSFGLAIRDGLSQLAAGKKEGSLLYAQNKVLFDQRDHLQQEERIIKVAAEIGLFPPRPDQVRRP